jgi:hypothetical protein
MRRILKCFLPSLLVCAHVSTAQNIITTIAGDGITQYIGDGTPATIYSLALPESVFVDKNGNVFIAEDFGQRIRKVTPSGTISTFAGTGAAGFSGDGGPASAAVFNKPDGIYLDTFGNFYVTENYNNRVRKIDAITGIITTVCGNGGGGYSGDGGQATAATLETPCAAAVDKAGNIYIPDYGNQRIRKVTAATGIISTIAGTGVLGYSGDGGQATNATLSYPTNIALDTLGNIYFAEFGNNVVRRVDVTSGIITTVAGTGANGYSGDGGPATAATFNQPNGVFVTRNGTLYISDYANNVIRTVLPSGVIFTIAGTGAYGYAGDGGPAGSATFYNPNAVFADNAGSLYISDGGNSVIRKITNPVAMVGGVSGDRSVTLYPNPCEGIFTVRNGGMGERLVQVFNVSGQVVFRKLLSGNEEEINISEQPQGLYFVQVVSDENTCIRRLIKK